MDRSRHETSLVRGGSSLPSCRAWSNHAGRKLLPSLIPALPEHGVQAPDQHTPEHGNVHHVSATCIDVQPPSPYQNITGPTSTRPTSGFTAASVRPHYPPGVAAKVLCWAGPMPLPPSGTTGHLARRPGLSTSSLTGSAASTAGPGDAARPYREAYPHPDAGGPHGLAGQVVEFWRSRDGRQPGRQRRTMEHVASGEDEDSDDPARMVGTALTGAGRKESSTPGSSCSPAATRTVGHRAG